MNEEIKVIHKGELEKMADEWGFEHENIGRRCRELCRAGLVEVVYEKSRKGALCAAYRWLPPIPKTLDQEKAESESLLFESIGAK